MPEFDPTPISKADLKEYLASAGDDFTFEMDVYRLTAAGAFSVDHGGTYQDPTTDVSRQFDIRATRHEQKVVNAERGIRVTQVVNLAVECKNLGEFRPLLLFRVPRLEREAFFEVAESSGMESRRLETRRQKKQTLYEVGKHVAKSAAHVGRQLGQSKKGGVRDKGRLRGDDEEIYTRWAQAVASAYDLIAGTTDFQPRAGHDRVQSITFPLLVVPNDRLWVVDYDEDGTQLGEPRPTPQSHYFIGKAYEIPNRRKSVDFTLSHLHFMTIDAYEKFLGQISQPKFWDSLFPQ